MNDLEKDLERGMTHLHFMLIILCMIVAFLVFLLWDANSQDSKDYNRANCAVYGLQADCKTPLK